MSSNGDRPWNILSSRIVIDSPHLRLRADAIELPDGTRIDDYYVREARGFTVIFARTADDRVVFVEQYKHGIGERVLELPAGGIDAGETELACAQRELEEETGFVGERFELVRTFITDPTNSDGRFHLYYVANAEERGLQELERTEDITVRLIPLHDLHALVRDGVVTVNSHVASIYVMLDRLGLLGASPRSERNAERRPNG